MSTTDDAPNKDVDREGATAEVLPALTALGETAATLEENQARGGTISDAEVATYNVQSAHVRHLMRSNDVTPEDVKTAQQQLRGTAASRQTTQALDHAEAPRHFEPTDPTKDTEEEIDL